MEKKDWWTKWLKDTHNITVHRITRVDETALIVAEAERRVHERFKAQAKEAIEGIDPKHHCSSYDGEGAVGLVDAISAIDNLKYAPEQD